jgi:DnaJ family protein A protein 1
MPMKRDIFEKGRLIIKFKVKFPENDFLPPSKLSELDKSPQMPVIYTL